MRTITLRRAALGLVAALGLALTASSAHAVHETTCPGLCKTNLFVRETYGTVSNFDQIGAIYGTLQKGKKGHVLRVEATASVNSHAAGIMDCAVFVNNHIIEGGALFGIDHGVSCQNAGMCFFTGSYWLDLDAAEAEFPGVYLNQPLDLIFQCSTYGNAGQRYGSTMSAELVKKK
jgi:hypothetical protein